jgi:hypothetical protein
MAHLPGGRHRGFLGIGKWRIWYRVRRHFLAFRGSRPGLFCNLSAGKFCPLRILDFVELRFPPLISREKNSGLPPVTSERASSPLDARAFSGLRNSLLPTEYPRQSQKLSSTGAARK